MTLRGPGLPQAASQRRTNSRWLRRSVLVGAVGLLAATLSGCSWSEALGLGWPEGITPEAHHNRSFWVGVVIASLIVGVIVWGLMFWCAVVYRKRAGDTELPRQFGYNMPLEVVLTVIPFLIISVLFYFTVLVQEDMLEIDPNPDVVVDVTAFQWNWKFGYNKIEFADGGYSYDGAQPERKTQMESKPEGVDAHGNELVGPIRGLNVEDRSFLYYDEVETLGTTQEIPVLVVPTGKRIEFRLIATDVVHAFFVPEFLFKRDMMPYPEANNSVNVFQVSEITKEGAFVGHCAEMCGTYHSMMNFELRAVSPNDFKRYMDFRRDGMTNAEALSQIGQSPVATSTRPFDDGRGLRAQANS